MKNINTGVSRWIHYLIRDLAPYTHILFFFFIIISIAYSASPVKSDNIELTCFEKKGVWENFELLDREITVILDKKGKLLFFSNTGILLKSSEIPDPGYPSAIKKLPYKKGNFIFICDTLNKRLITLKNMESSFRFYNFKKKIFPVDITFNNNNYYVLDNRNLNIIKLNSKLKPIMTFGLKDVIDKKDLLTSICKINDNFFITSWYGKLYVCTLKNNKCILSKKIEFKGSSFTSIRESDDDKLIITDLIGRVIYYSLKNGRIEEQITSLINPVDALECNSRLYVLNSGDYSIKVYKKSKSVVNKKSKSVIKKKLKKTDSDVAKLEKLKRKEIKIIPEKEEFPVKKIEKIQEIVKIEKIMITNLEKYEKKLQFIKFDANKIIAKLVFDFDYERYRFSDDSKDLREKLSFDNFKIFFDSVEIQMKKIKILSKRNNYVLLEFQLTKNYDPVELILILKWNYDIIQKKFKLKK